MPKINRYWNSDPDSLVERKPPQTYLRNIDEPIPIEIYNGGAEKFDLNKIELERAMKLVDFCRSFLCGLKVGKNG